MSPSKQASRASQAGFTLVELMVSLAIGTLIVIAMIVLLANTSRNNADLIKNNKLIDSAKAAAFHLELDLNHAGYWGGYVPDFDDLTVAAASADLPDAILDPCGTYPPAAASVKNLIGIPIQSYRIENVSGTPTSPVCAGIVQSPVADSDVLVVRYADRETTTATGNELRIQVNRCGTTRPSPGYVLSNVNADFNLTQYNCTTASEIRRVTSHIYYVRNYARTVGDNIPTLMRSRLGWNGTTLVHAAAEPLVEGVENFRVEMGIDNRSATGGTLDFSVRPAFSATNQRTPSNRGDGAPDTYLRCSNPITTTVPPTPSDCGPTDLASVAAVKFHLLLRTDPFQRGTLTDTKTYQVGPGAALGPFNDRFVRHVFTQTVRVANLSSRRESP